MMELKQVDMNGNIKTLGIGAVGIRSMKAMIDSHIDCSSYIAIDQSEENLQDCHVDAKLILDGDKWDNIDQQLIERDISGLLDGTELVQIIVSEVDRNAIRLATKVAKLAQEIKDAFCIVYLVRNEDVSIEPDLETLNAFRSVVCNVIEVKGEDSTTNSDTSDASDVRCVDVSMSIMDLLYGNGFICFDMADLKCMMNAYGQKIVAVGYGEGENRAKDAIVKALHAKTKEGLSFKDARYIMLHYMTDEAITLDELGTASEILEDYVGERVDIIWGQFISRVKNDERVKVTLIATGISGESM